MKTIWHALPKPILIQAPMDGVTDTAFRRILAYAGKPDIFFTEFTNTDGLCSKGKQRLLPKLFFTQEERPIIGQIWGKNPENYYKTAQMLVEMKFDGIDINMGCPERSIVKNGCCSALIKDHQLAAEIIQATKEGAGNLPVSVKTRLGLDRWVTDEWVSFLLQQDIAALTLHGRIAKEMSHFPARWDEIGKAVKIKKKMKSNTIIIGNGDVQSVEDAYQKVKTYGVDGVMIGRSALHNVQVFNKDTTIKPFTRDEKLRLLIKHLEYFQYHWGANSRRFESMKKFYSLYVSDFPHAVEFKVELMKLHTVEETIQAIKSSLVSQSHQISI